VNGAPLADPRAALHIADAKTFLRESRRSYDVIISEPSNPWVSGVGGLFSAGFYHEARSRLRPGGALVIGRRETLPSTAKLTAWSEDLGIFRRLP